MKILIVMAGFFPGKKYGGPPVSVDNFCSLMAEDECYIITHNHDNGEHKAYDGIISGTWKERDNCKVMYLSDDKYNKKTFEEKICEIRPDLIYLQGLFQECVLPCLQLAKKNRIKVLLAPRGELCSGAFKKKYKKLPYIYYLRTAGLLNNVAYQSTSEEESEAIIKYLKAGSHRINFLTNIPSIPKKEYCRNEKHVNQGRFVFLSRIHPKKNLLFALEFFKKIQGNIIFDIYGPIEDESYWEECKKEIKVLPQNIAVNYCGLVAHDQVHEVFSNYDAFVFPTFSENYGHVIAEALMVGTPVIISDQTPWTDVNGAKAGYSYPLENIDMYETAIQKIVDMSNEEFRNMQVNIEKYLDEKVGLDRIKNQYKHCFMNIAGGDK